jgi:hypothetical protein
MNLTERIDSFVRLGNVLRNALAGSHSGFATTLMQVAEVQYIKNPWFTAENVRMALGAIAVELTEEKLKKWTSRYPVPMNNSHPVKVGVIMAGNIPLVGFHDFLSVLITGNNIIVKTSSRDSDLIVSIGDILCDINTGFREKIEFTKDVLTGFDAVIATGSDNTSRYFESYFAKYPNIIRKNRNSIAIIDGSETRQELEALGMDIFSYFGLGCRNVSRLFIHEGVSLEDLTGCWNRFSEIITHSKYASNYDFYKAVALVNKEKFHDTGFVLLKENQELSSPVAVLYYGYFRSLEQVEKYIYENSNKIQCIVGRNHLPFGTAQSPSLWDYADGVDTLEFLLKKNIAGLS